jgi:hypothetical protein
MAPVSKKSRNPYPASDYPVSPAFVHNYHHVHAPVLSPMSDYCAKKQIPFSKEEENLYKLNTNQRKFQNYKNTINHLYESGRPDEIDIGVSILKNSPNAPPPH